MPLIGADFAPVFAEAVALLAVRAHDFLQNRKGNAVLSGRIDAVQQLLRVRPAVFIDHNADGLRMVAQNQADEFAQPGERVL